MLEEYIEKLKPIILELFSEESSGHDIAHLERTMKIALYLQQKEGGDRIIIGISAFLHDIHRIMQKENGGVFVSPKDSLEMVKNILSNIELTQEQIDKICYAIEFHENYNWNGENVNDINTLILQDADNLDAIGAIGIGRAFAYGGAHNMKMYDDKIPLNNQSDYIEGKISASTIHHFYHKLFKLADNMNTKTAKEIGIQRTEFMRNFVQEFLFEWNGEKELLL